MTKVFVDNAWYLIVIKRFSYFLLFPLVVACYQVDYSVGEEPEDLIPTDTMVGMLTDMHLIEGARTGNSIIGDTLLMGDYYRRVYEKYGVTDSAYAHSFNYYNRDPKLMSEMYDQVIDRLSKLEWKLQEEGVNPGDTVLAKEAMRELMESHKIPGSK